MSAYNPPIENVPIIDSSLFSVSDTSLTKAEADLLYLHYPIGQGNETIPSLTINGSKTIGANIIMSGVANTNYIQFPDGSKQYIASSNLLTSNNTWTGTNYFNNATPLTTSATMPPTSDSSNKIPTTAWVRSAISAIPPAFSLIQVNTYTSSQTITPPANTYKMDIFVFGSGGLGGNGNDFGSYYVFGGSGAGGNMVSCSNLLWNSSTTMTLFVNAGVQGSYTEIVLGAGLGTIRCYNGGNGGAGQSSGTGTAGAVNTTSSSVPSSIGNWYSALGKAGQAGTSDIFPPPLPLVPNTIGGGINNTPQKAGMIGAGQSWGNGATGGYSPSPYTNGGCMITWYKTA